MRGNTTLFYQWESGRGRCGPILPNQFKGRVVLGFHPYFVPVFVKKLQRRVTRKFKIVHFAFSRCCCYLFGRMATPAPTNSTVLILQYEIPRLYRPCTNDGGVSSFRTTSPLTYTRRTPANTTKTLSALHRRACASNCDTRICKA